MDCKELLEMLPEYFCGELDRLDVTRVTTHLLACDACQQEATELRKVLGVLARVELPQPGEEFCRNLTERIIAAAKSDSDIVAPPEAKVEPVKIATPEPKVEPVNVAPVIPAPAPKIVAPKPAPPEAKPAKVVVPKPAPPVKRKVERTTREPRRPLITSWKWVTRGVLPAAAAILVLIIARNLLITDQSYENAPDSTKEIASAPAVPAAEEGRSALTSPTSIQDPMKSPAPTLPGAMLPPSPPAELKSSNTVRGDVTTMAGISIPPASPTLSQTGEGAKTTGAADGQYTKTEATGYMSATKHVESEQKKSVETERLAEMAYGAAESAEIPAEHSSGMDGKDKMAKEETPAAVTREYRKATITAEVRDEAKDDYDKSRSKLAGASEKGVAGAEFLPAITSGQVSPKVADAIYLLDLVGSPAPLEHEETLLFATEATEATMEDEAVYSDIEPQVPLVTDYELLNTLNSMDKTRMDDLMESMVNETGGSK